MKSDDFVSVVMPTFNGEKYIKIAIQSILEQTHCNLELIIVDDGSSDTTSNIISLFNDKRIKYYYQENKGPAETYNVGFRLARGEYILIMDHDDVSSKNRIQRLLEYSIANALDVCGSWYQLINVKGEKIDVRCNPVSDIDIKNKLIYKNYSLFHPTILFKKKIFDVYGFYDPRYFPSYDYEYLLRIADKVNFGNIDEYLYSWRINPASISHCNLKSVYERTKEISLKYLNKTKSGLHNNEYFHLLGCIYYYNNEMAKALRAFLTSLFYGNIGINNIRYVLFSGPFGLIIKFMRKCNLFYSLPLIKFRKISGL